MRKDCSVLTKLLRITNLLVLKCVFVDIIPFGFMLKLLFE